MKRFAYTNLLALASTGILACGSQEVTESSASEEASGDTGEVVVAQPAKNVTCRNIKATGSHMVRRVCVTKEEKEALEDSSKDWVRSRGGSGSPTKILDPDDPRARKN